MLIIMFILFSIILGYGLFFFLHFVRYLFFPYDVTIINSYPLVFFKSFSFHFR